MCWVAFLWDEEVAELAEDYLAWAEGCAVVSEGGQVGGLVGAVEAGVGCVEDSGVFGFAGGGVAVGGVVRTVPVVLPFGGGFLEDFGAVRAECVVAETEVFVEDHCALGDPLVAVFATYFVGRWWIVIVWIGVILARGAIEWCSS